ncbi:transglutaminase-like cysteine peptidase [Roseobacter sp.]|uniref:transglutaminase-like cysteine peptidase n=1 Tax=Roseobacter sp. TaxID=1907202 RepID=UPI0032967D4B
MTFDAGEIFDKWRTGAAAVAVLSAVILAAPTSADAGDTAFLSLQQPTPAPAGFHGLCARYDWVCAPSARTTLDAATARKLARDVNRKVNRQIHEIADQAQYGKEEYWSLPSRRGGDCEDFALLKKKLLVESGIASQSLLIATVLDRKLNSHAVLVFRTTAGDVVLDNLTNRILSWEKTGYTFLKLQNPKALQNWGAVLAGGIISGKPTASF